MKITKAMGRAALNDMRFSAEIGGGIAIHANTVAAYEAIFGDEVFNGRTVVPFSQEEALTALALCAAIAGVKPEDVE